MRNLKKKNLKGFTLVELIVVMAIIGVLAAILVPTMLGFMRDANTTKANANAKTVYSAANAVVTKYLIDNPALTADASGSITESDFTATIDSVDFDLSSYLNGFKGSATIVLNSTGTGVWYTVWSIDSSTAPAGDQISKADQEDGTTSLGGYPLAESDGGSSSNSN